MNVSQQVLKKMKQFDKLMLQFPWLWALRSSWSFGTDYPLPVVQEANAGMMEDSLWRDKKWWAVLESQNDIHGCVTTSVERLDTDATIREGLLRHVEIKNFSVRVLYLVSMAQISGKGKENYVIYVPPKGAQDLNGILLV